MVKKFLNYVPVLFVLAAKSASNVAGTNGKQPSGGLHSSSTAAAQAAAAPKTKVQC